jgi:hypothetical protein
MAVKRWRVSAIAGKVEPVSGTDSVPTLAANAVNFIGLPPELVVAYLESGDRGDVVYGGMGGEVAPSAPAGRYGTLRVRMEAKGNNLGYNETGVQFAEVDAFLRAAGFDNVSGVYSSLDDALETMSLYCWSAGNVFKLTGCVVSRVRLSARVNQRAFWEFEIQGVMAADPAALAMGAVTLSAIIPPIFANSAVVVGTLNYAGGLLVKEFAYERTGTVATRGGAGAPDGLVGFAITDARTRLTMTIEQMALGTFDPYARSKDPGAAPGTDLSGSLLIGGTALNRILLEWGRWRLDPPGNADNEGLADWTLAGDLVANSLAVNNRESRISFT